MLYDVHKSFNWLDIWGNQFSYFTLFSKKLGLVTLRSALVIQESVTNDEFLIFNLTARKGITKAELQFPMKFISERSG